MTNTTTKPRLTSLAPQFLVDDLARSIAYYQKLGFTFGEPWDGFYAIGQLDGLELHLKEAPKNADERRYRPRERAPRRGGRCGRHRGVPCTMRGERRNDHQAAYRDSVGHEGLLRRRPRWLYRLLRGSPGRGKLKGSLFRLNARQTRTNTGEPVRVRVLMTGGYGCIGSWVAKQLVDQGRDVWIYDLKEDTHRLDLLLSQDERSQVHFLQGDVADAKGLQAAAVAIEATHLLHLAGLQVPTCRADPLLGARVNVLGTLAVFETAVVLRGQIERVVYASSAAVHGPADPMAPGPVGDEVRLAPLTHYGAFKVCNELNARVYWLDQGVSSVGLRPWTVYGVGRDFGVTSEPTKAIKAVAARRPYAISYGGSQDLQYVGDVAATFSASPASSGRLRVQTYLTPSRRGRFDPKNSLPLCAGSRPKPRA